jgi:hypothetical protein
MNATVCGLVDELASGFVTGMMKEWTGDGWTKSDDGGLVPRKARNQILDTV